ncbi:MAG: non-specific phospholipase, partial [Actinomycetia bacterium]|nr:non-specific phospholipase [Actinomycetes bacterium]
MPDRKPLVVTELSRRRFLTLAGATGALAASGTLRPPGASGQPATLPRPAASGIEHVVVVCMENRSFDHYLGWVKGADGRQAGLTFPDQHGAPRSTHHLDDRQGCGWADPDHSYEGGRVQFAGGKCNGFRQGDNDDFALGYYERADLPLTAALVDGYTIADRWFCSILGPTYPNRLYTHAAATDRISNTTALCTLPTIWDRLAAAGVPATYYFSDVPFLALWGPKYLPIARPLDTFFDQARTGVLPAYSYLDPTFIGEDQGGSNDDHPHADILRGQALLSRIVRAVTESPAWGSTVLVITYDEWGGFFDHVRPPRFADAFRPTATEDHGQAGFRVPTYVVSPFARRRAVAHEVFDHTSILKLVEWRWGL